MCSSCGGGKAAALRIPGASPRNPILFGQADGRPAQPATLLKEHSGGEVGQYLYVSGVGVEKAVSDGIVQLGYAAGGGAAKRLARPVPKAATAPEHYVATGRNKWVGFHRKTAAERYAKSIGAVVLTHDEVLKANLKTEGD